MSKRQFHPICIIQMNLEEYHGYDFFASQYFLVMTLGFINTCMKLHMSSTQIISVLTCFWYAIRISHFYM